MDEGICPCDYKKRGIIIDDDINAILTKLPEGSRLTVVMDCCHSGSICDVDSFNFEHEIVALASAQDSQESLDMASFGRSGGILTTAIGDALEEMKYENKHEFSVHEIYNR